MANGCIPMHICPYFNYHQSLLCKVFIQIPKYSNHFHSRTFLKVLNIKLKLPHHLHDSQIPESPLWLLAKNQTDAAKTALCWLRGFVSPEVPFDEFQSLQRYNERSKSCGLCLKQRRKCCHSLPSVIAKLKELQRKQTLKPFFIVITLICMLQFSRLITLKSFIVQIFRAYESPVPPDQAAAVLNLMNNIAHVAFLFIIHFTGKRRLYLIMLMMIFLSTIALCSYGFAILPKGSNSFDVSQHFFLSNKHLAYIPFICIIISSFCSYCGVNAAPSQMLSELFSFKYM